MVAGARVDVPYPEVAVVERATLDEQTDAIADALAPRPIALGGCCCTHVGAATGVARRRGSPRTRLDRRARRLEHAGDLPVRESLGHALPDALDAGVVAPADAALVGARNLDPPEEEYMAAVGLDDSIERALAGTDATYVALDLDVLDPSEVDVLIREPDGLSADELEALVRDLASRTRIVGIGVTGLLATDRNAALATRMLAAAGF